MYNHLSWLEGGTVNPEVVGSIPAKTQKNWELKSTWIWAT